MKRKTSPSSSAAKTELSAVDAAVAATQNWMLRDVYTLETGKWLLQILPIKMTPEMPHPLAAFSYVRSRAEERDALAIRALQLVVKSNLDRSKK